MNWDNNKTLYEQEPEVFEWAQNLIDTTERQVIRDDFNRPVKTSWSDGTNTLVQTVDYKHPGSHPETITQNLED